jgi:4-hydroxy-tetrahydrodipicolinate reductase
MIRIAVIGASGRMGRELINVAQQSADVRVSAALVSAGSTALGRDAGELAGVGNIGVRVTSDLAAGLSGADVVLDFSQPHVSSATLAACRAAGKPLLIGTTGIPSEVAHEFASAAREIALLVAPNTSLGVTLLMELVRQAALALPADFDIEIIEAHHRTKRDAPSGTAIALGEAAAAARRGPAGALTPEELRSARTERQMPRVSGEIGFAVLRGGDLVGEHTVLFAGTGERLTLSHTATDRAVFARGAIEAARYLARRPPGRYTMRDVISAKSVT